MVVEGEKCADAAKSIFPDHVVVTSAGGAGSAGESDWTVLRGRSHALIWPDLDTPGAKYAVDVKGILAALGIADISIVDAQRLADGDLAFSEREKVEGWDVADVVDEGHASEAIREAAIAAAQPSAASKSVVNPDGIEKATTDVSAAGLPYGYNLSSKGLTWSDPNDEEKPPLRIASYFTVVAETRDHDGGSWGVLLHWNDHDGRHHQHALPRSSLAGGASSTGKSTALHVAGSVWGGGDTNGYVRSWRATANGLEGVALSHSDTLLCLDELSQLAAKDAGEAAYMLANGAGKSRSLRDGSARRASKWQVLFLSSGEIGLADKVAEDGRGRKLAAGQQVRIVDVPADAGEGMGMFEKLHGYPSAEVFSRKLKAAAQQNYGVAAREYLAAIVPDLDGIKTAVTVHMAKFVSQHVPEGADGQVERVAQRFALIAAGGELAATAGIVPWEKGVATAAAERCFADWLVVRGGIEPAEDREGIQQVRSFIQANGVARFIPAWEGQELEGKSIIFRDVAGYRRKSEQGWDYYVTTTAWKEEVCIGLDPRRVAATLGAKGLLHRSGKDQRWANVVNVPGYGKVRLYHLPAALLEGDDA